MNLPNNDDLPWEEDTSMMHPRAPRGIEIATAIPLCVEMNAIELQPKWRGWMMHWVHWDKEDQTYVGTCPDMDEVCREKYTTIFLLLFEEASSE